MKRKMLCFVPMVIACMLAACGNNNGDTKGETAENTVTPTPTVENVAAITPVVIEGMEKSALVPLAKLTGEVEKMPGTKALVQEKKEAEEAKKKAQEEKKKAEEKAAAEAKAKAEAAAKEQAEAEAAAQATETPAATETPVPAPTDTPAVTPTPADAVPTEEPEGPWEDPALN